MKGPLFYSKILLFGEYGIIKDSKGLSIPYNFFKGALKTEENDSAVAQKSNESLRRFATYLADIDKTIVTFDIDSLKSDLEEGMLWKE